MRVNEKTMSNATGLPIEGERRFNNKLWNHNDYIHFLKYRNVEVDWEKGVLHSHIVEKWKNILMLLENYLTCEGKYAMNFQYHILLLLHFESGNLLNIPHCLCHNLRKMAR